MRSALTATTQSITHPVSSAGADTPVYLRVSIKPNTDLTTVTGTFRLDMKNMWEDDSAYSTVTTWTGYTYPDAVIQVVGQLRFRLMLSTVSAGGAMCELISNL